MEPNVSNSILNAAKTFGLFIGIDDDGAEAVTAVQKTPVGWNFPSAFKAFMPWPAGLNGKAFGDWLGYVLNSTNDHIHDIIGGQPPATLTLAQIATPAAWNDVVSYVLANFHITDTGYVASGSAPQPAPSETVLWLKREFLGRKIVELGLDAKGNLVIEVNAGDGVWKRCTW